MGNNSLNYYLQKKKMKNVCLLCLFLILFACATPHIQKKNHVTVDPQLRSDGFLTEDQYWLPFRSYKQLKNPTNIVIALHGFNDYSKAFDGMCDFLFNANIQCIAYDQRGFGNTAQRGLSPGPGRFEKDIKLLLKEIKNRYGDTPVYLLGESMGGAIIINALASHRFFWKRHLKGAILLAPAVWARQLQPWYQRYALKVMAFSFPTMKLSGSSLNIMPTDNQAVNYDMARDKNVIKKTRVDSIWGLTNLMDNALLKIKQLPVPSLILYGKKDEVIPKKATCAMLKRINPKTQEVDFIVYSHGYHLLTRDLQAKKVFVDITHWIESPVSLQKSSWQKYCAT